MTLQQMALDVAITQLGVEEHPRGSNRGPEVDQYIKSVGLDPAGKFAWCAAFLYWCFEKAADRMSRKNPLAKTAGVMDHWSKRKGAYRVTGAPRPGDIGIMSMGKGAGHTFIVEAVHADHVDTIEGNTNDEGSREGFEVCRRSRKLVNIIGFLRYE